MTTEHRYSIKYVCLRTGLKPHLIRSWESRYRAIRPRRSASNRRVFTDDDIHRLYLLKLAVASGHTISHVARLGDPDLKRLLAEGGRRVGDTDKPAPAVASAAQGAVPRDGEKMVDAALDHITGLDPAALEKVLNQAALDLPRQALLQSVILPLFARIGQLWHRGKIKAIHEQVASVVVRAMLSEMLRAVVVPSSAPKIIVATPTGHWHELGALSAALAASESGWRVVYCGPNLPADEIAYAVVKLRGQAVALGISHALDGNRLAAELRLLRRLVGASLPIFVCGIGADVHRMSIRPTHATVCDHLGELRDRLDRLLDAAAARSTPAAPRHLEIRDAPLR
jgi:DNA-binding transcriptional MerR regulator/methylmalonyl-CoA mutase cobalamin-binding subunit